MDYQELLADAKQAIDNSIKTGTVFEVKSLFAGHKWDELKIGQKRYFGVYFSNAFNDGNIPNIRRYEESKNHHNRYMKI